MPTFRLLACTLLCLALLAAPALAKSPKALAAENAELKARLEALESEMGQIKEMLVAKADAEKAAQEKAAAAPKAEKPAVRSAYETDLYGYVKFDAAYDTNRMSPGNYSQWVLQPGALNKKDGQFTSTARQTRFGVNVKGPDTFKGAKTTANLEADFYGTGGATEAKPTLRLRHAWMQFEWPELDLKLKAGNTSDIVSPLNPSTVDFVVRWWAGNPGERHPQIGLTKGFKIDETHRFDLTVGASRTQGSTSLRVASDSGQESGQPTAQGRLAYTFPGFHGLKTVVGLSGLYGKDEFDYSVNDDAVRFKSRGVFADLDMPLHKLWKVSGEWFSGKNLDDYNAGVGQGMLLQGSALAANTNGDAVGATRVFVNGVNGAAAVSPLHYTYLALEEIKTTGGWMQLNFNPAGPFDYNVGYSRDRVTTDRLALPATARKGNYAAWANLYYDIGKNSQFALEYSRWLTDYVAGNDGHAHRVQSALIYKF